MPSTTRVRSKEGAFCYAEDKSIEHGLVRKPLDFAGSIWTWVAIDSDTKLIVSCKAGLRKR